MPQPGGGPTYDSTWQGYCCAKVSFLANSFTRLNAYEFPKENWKSLRTSNPIESVFAGVRLRTEAAKRMRTGKSATYLVFALITRLAKNWNRIHGYEKIAPFIAAKKAAME